MRRSDREIKDERLIEAFIAKEQVMRIIIWWMMKFRKN